MNRNIITLVIAAIFLISGLVFVIKEEWIFATAFIVIGVIYLLKMIKMRGSNDDDSSE
ncbi:Uncharacterised protein [Staphylococcus microti]|uniref:Phage protein n=1 Tax=Staphylococcus microti TaxID=569857 RepID=A0A380GT63_9STAP|nr:hypothetical protein [Staphylococcus microti]SUM56944.1 Uncharacterised protein [Staphylococcus microti]